MFLNEAMALADPTLPPQADAASAPRGAWARWRRAGQQRPRWYYTAPLVAWLLLISAASLGSPSNLPQLDIPLSDKLEHLAAYLMLGLLLLRGWTRQSRPGRVAIVSSFILASLWGLYLEFMQGLTPNRTYDLWDQAVNTLGVALGVVLWTLWRRFASDRF
jgi:VanZ family protein